MKFIDDVKEHIRILYELGILDDEEDWALFQKMERENDIDEETWRKYMRMRDDLN